MNVWQSKVLRTRRFVYVPAFLLFLFYFVCRVCFSAEQYRRNLKYTTFEEHACSRRSIANVDEWLLHLMKSENTSVPDRGVGRFSRGGTPVILLLLKSDVYTSRNTVVLLEFLTHVDWECFYTVSIL